MIRRIRFDWSLPLETLTELHVGSGESRAATRAEVQRGIIGEIATFVRDADGQPWIPGATLKGALRNGRFDTRTNALFGMAHCETAPGRLPPVLASAVTVFGAFANSGTAVDPLTRPRTAVSAGTGASEANKLFTEEWVAAGTRFTARLRLELRRRQPSTGNADDQEDDTAFADRAHDLRTRFEAELLRFCGAEGVEIAADKSDGMGRVWLPVARRDGRLLIPCTRKELGANGWSAGTSVESAMDPPLPRVLLHDFALSCPGPYIAKGGVREEEIKDKARKTTIPERVGRQPRMHPSGLSGALRNRADWMLAIARLRDPNCWPNVRCKTSSGTKELNIVQQLFGDEGWRGSLNIHVVGKNCTGKEVFPFVMLDSVTQGPVGDPLFRIEADCGVTAILQIGAFRSLSSVEQDFLSSLVKEVVDNGIFLGGGSSKGFGWFNVQQTSSTRIGRSFTVGSLLPALKVQLPDKRISLPYRIIKADPSRILWPEKPVADRITARTLLCDPIPEGMCGWLDVSWCVETPILIGNGADPVSPQMLHGVPVLPGATIRGMLRGIVETITQAQFGRLDAKTMSAPVGKQIARAGAQATHQNFRPDFARALFGHVIQPETTGQQQNSSTHAAHHLKSRLAFGYAPLLEFDADRIDDERVMKLSSPNPAATFYDSPGRKTYFATGGTAAAVSARLDAGTVPADNQTTRLKFLNPGSKGPLVFRGRILFHNVTMAELGALLWAITFGNKPFLRHRIGHARAYGAGRGYADDLTLHIVPNNGSNPVPAGQNDFGICGHCMDPAVNSFRDLLREHGLSTHHSALELLVSADPAIGDEIRAVANLRPPKDIRYQISEPFKGTPLGADVRTGQGGRLAAMLRPKPED